MAVQAFLMAGDHTEIADMMIGLQLGAEQTRGIFHEYGIGRVQFGKGLFIFALDHHLSFGRHSAAAQRDQIFEPQTIGVAIDNHRNP